MNIGLLCKWWWKLEREEGVWQEIIEKNTQKGNTSEVTGGVAVVEARVLALPGRGSVEVVTGSAEDVSTSEVVSAEAAGCDGC